MKCPKCNMEVYKEHRDILECTNVVRGVTYAMNELTAAIKLKQLQIEKG